MQALCSLYFWRSLPGPECQPYSQLLILRNEENQSKNRILRWWSWQSGARRGDEGDGTGGGKGGHSRILAPGRVGEAYVLVVRLRSGAAERVDFFFQERLKVGWNTVGGLS